MEKEQALENAKSATEYVPKKQLAQVTSQEANPWSNVVKKRSRLEMEQDQIKEAKAAGESATTDLISETTKGPMTKKQKIAEQENYWAQFGSGDIFSQTVKRKSKLELDQEAAAKARIHATEQALKIKNKECEEKVVLKF